jgi:hypothetical protein
MEKTLLPKRFITSNAPALVRFSIYSLKQELRSNKTLTRVDESPAGVAATHLAIDHSAAQGTFTGNQ